MKATIEIAAKTRGEAAHAEPVKFTKRVGSTNYVVSVHFSRATKETLEDKILRLIRSEVGKLG